MLDRIRERTRIGSSRAGAKSQRRVTRREREDRQKRLLYIATGVAGVVVILALLVGAAYQYYFYPRSEVASVNGDKIERRDYWKVRELQLRQNLAQISQQYQITQPDQRPQLEQQAQEIQTELDDLRGADLRDAVLSDAVLR
ncbi:MAG TPA: SurA N-terminal domain-containing protein, partial [Thermomicrobiales bacterium]|nr:SurA N-terminal domain-containing protein [Thermomicrobiales bacterium]